MLFTEEQVLEQVLASVTPCGSETLPLTEALDRVLAEDVAAQFALPCFDNSTMDGYALIAAETKLGARFQIIGEQPAGVDRGLTVVSGTCVRIYTGAPIPKSADAVIMQEDVERHSREIIILDPVTPGENVRLRGGDLAAGQKIAGKGKVLTSRLLAVLASQGKGEVQVYRRPRVAVLATGSELRRAGQELAPGEIYESNRIMLTGLIRRDGGSPDVFDIIPDDLDLHCAALERGRAYDVVVIAGGMSVGEKDFVRPALEKIGASAKFWRVAVKPGKPFLFSKLDQTLVFGLPGNPVSAYVTFLLFVRPALLRAGGREKISPSQRRVEAGERLINKGDRPHYLRGRLTDGRFFLSGKQESHALFALAQADALMRLQPGQEIAPGESISVIPLR